MKGFTEQEKNLLIDLRQAANDITGCMELILARTSKNGESRLALCILRRNHVLHTYQIEPIALMMSSEEANDLENPFTGKRGLPWVDMGNSQLELQIEWSF